MKNYSFSNITAQDSYPAHKSNVLPNEDGRSNLKYAQKNSRVEEIKKKYDTSLKRQRMENLKKSVDLCPGSKGIAKGYSKSNRIETKENNLPLKDNYSNYYTKSNLGDNNLKQSFALNRIQKSTISKDMNSMELNTLKTNDNGHFKSIDQLENVYCIKPQFFEDENIIFSKVREMKESILNNEIMRSSINPRSSISSTTFSQLTEPNSDHSRLFDPRVENIDKINAKIKQILSCLAEDQNNPSKFLKDKVTEPATKQARLNPSQIQVEKKTYLKPDKLNQQSDSMKQTSCFYKANKFTQDNSCVSQYQLGIEKQKIMINLVQRPTVHTKMQERTQKLKIQKNEYTPMNGKQIASLKQPSHEQNKSLKQYRDYSVNKIDSYVQNRNILPKEVDFVRTPNYVKKDQEAKSVLKTSQSINQISSVKKSTFNDNEKSDVLKSGKKINEQISKIQKKIEQFEAQKKKLNIQFTPFCMKNKSSTNLVSKGRSHTLTPQKMEQRKKLDTSTILPHFTRINQTKDNKLAYLNKQSTGQISKVKSSSLPINENVCPSKEETNPKVKQTNFNYKMERVNVKSFKTETNHQKNQKFTFDGRQDAKKASAAKQFDCSLYQDELRKRTDQGIQQRKNILKNADQIVKTEGFTKLITLFCQQAKLDQAYRNMKIWLECDFNKDKFNIISKLLSKLGLQVSSSQCQLLFKVEESENNPFFSSQDFKGSYELLAKAYLDAKGHWQTKIKHKFDRQNLKNQGFTVNKIDLYSKGYIQLQDIVRLLNIDSGTFFRNRDIFLIFRRLTKGEKLNFEDIMRQVCN